MCAYVLMEVCLLSSIYIFTHGQGISDSAQFFAATLIWSIVCLKKDLPFAFTTFCFGKSLHFIERVVQGKWKLQAADYKIHCAQSIIQVTYNLDV